MQDARGWVLGITSAARSPRLPAVPTVAEAGLPGFESTTGAGLAVPKGVPGEVPARLHAALLQVLAGQGLRQRLEEADGWRGGADGGGGDARGAGGGDCEVVGVD